MGGIVTPPRSPEVAAPTVVFNGHEWPASGIAGLADGWRAAVEPEIVTARVVAMVMTNHPRAVTLFLALAGLSAPVVLLPPEPRTWKSSPPLPASAPLVLPPEMHGLASDAERVGLSP